MWLATALVLAVGALAGCGVPSGQLVGPGPVPADPIAPPALPPGVAAMIRVPQDAPTIQAAVDAARPGQIILIAPGIYHEAVRVKTPGITIRGADRNRVILDGGYHLPNGIEVESNNVVLENLTAEHYLANGFYWEGNGAFLSGYRGSYLTAYDNGDYGIYAYYAQNGQFDHDYAAGQPDSGIYIGHCYPCNAVIDQVTSEWNALGYSGANSGGNLIIRDSVWRENLGGFFVGGVGSDGPFTPARQTIIYHNVIENNNNLLAAAKRFEYPFVGTGIVLGGSVGSVVLGNTIDREQLGIVVTANPSTQFWLSEDNRILGNTITRSSLADVAMGAPSGPNNCFAGNHYTHTVPPLIDQKYPCDSPLARLQGGAPSLLPLLLARQQYAIAHRPRVIVYPAALPALRDQPQMPNALGPAGPIFPDLSLFRLPAAAHAPDVPRAHLLPANFGGSAMLQILLGLYAELLPIALYAAWLAVAFWDLARNDRLALPGRLGWMVALVAVPILGPVAYYLFGGSQLSRSFRLMFVIGAPVLYLLVTGLLVALASM